MNNKDYFNEMKNIKPKEELIQKTISNIKERNEVEKMNKGLGIRRILTGAAAMLILSAGTVGAYVAVTGNTEILEKIGIKLSQNYEENAQEINEENSSKNTIVGENFEAKLVSASIDSTNIVMEIDLRLDEKYELSNPDLKVSDIRIYRPSTDDVIGDEFRFSENQNVEQMEDGTYKIFKYVTAKDPALAVSGIWKEVFGNNEFVECMMSFSGVYDDDNLIEKIDVDDNFDFELEKPNNLMELNEVEEKEELLKYNNVRALITNVQKSSFGNIIELIVREDNIDLDELNDIQKIDFKMTNEEGENIKIISRTDNVTLGNYKNGKLNMVQLEIQLNVDDIDTIDYNIEIVENNKITVNNEKIKEIENDIIESYKNGETVLTLDEISYPIDQLEDYYIDNYGVYRIDKTSAELDGIDSDDVIETIDDIFERLEF